MPAITSIKLRQGTAAAWTSANPTLLAGEPGYETDTGKLKIGNGTSTWTALAYWDDQSAPLNHSHPSTQITDSTATGRSVLTAADAAAARTAIGAGTSSLALGTTGTTAKAGNWFPSFAEVTGSLSSAQLPPLAINTVTVVADQTAMLALTAERGDMAIRTDNGKTFVLSTDAPATLADWKEITASGAVTSVAGKTGTVTLAKADVGLSNVDNTSDASKPVSTAQQTALNAKENSIAAGTTAQVLRGDKTWVTADKALVGLSNVDNTSDANKPVSTAQQTALNLKANLASPTFTGTVTLPSTTNGLTKSNVGLANVDNTADSAKPISTATQTALNGKANSTHSHSSTDILSIDGGTP
jgi:Major tropism determinant N-terminal domain